MILGLIYFAVAGMTTNAFMTRWSFREDGLTASGFRFQTMLEGHATRPWAYRVLMPQLTEHIAAATPDSVKQRLSGYLMTESGVRDRYFRAPKDQWTRDLALRYHLAYGLVFFSVFATLWLLRGLPHRFGVPESPLTDLAPLAFGALLPLAYLSGGYMYDFPELMFLTSSFAVACWNPWGLVALVPIATLNKETALLAPILVAPIILMRHSTARKANLTALAVTLALGILTYALVRSAMAGNPGGSVEVHIRDNLIYWINPRNYLFGFSGIYSAGLPTPKFLNILILPALLIVGKAAWKRAPTELRYLVLVAMVINLPLLAAFGDRDELRNLSLLFVPLYLLFVKSASAQAPNGRLTRDIPRP
jgi:hypothetical protein